MENLKEETIRILNRCKYTIDDVDYCYIHSESYFHEGKIYCKGSLILDLLDFKYDNGYGGQEIGGFIVFKDKTWLERREYDGSEWWEYFSTPEKA
jgi:hypothetical protein